MNRPADSTPSEYIVLDTWVLSKYTHGPIANNLSALINENGLIILADTFALIELYSPHWYSPMFIGRTRYASEFLVDHPSKLVSPQEVLLAEVRSFPSPLPGIPNAFDLESVHWSARDFLLRGLFRRDKVLLHLGMDLHAWSKDYRTSKARWPTTVQTIIEHAASAGLLAKRSDGCIDALSSHKEEFLRYLDRRFLKIELHRRADPQELLHLSENVANLTYGATSLLPGVRLTSLAFWYAYVEIDKAFPMPRRGSDLADIYRIALLPYSRYFTADSAMERIIRRALVDLPQSTEVIGPSRLKEMLDELSPEPGSLLWY
jgi:hypothetical protein